MDRGTWQITAYGVTKSWTQLHMHSHVPKADYLAGSVLNVSHNPHFSIATQHPHEALLSPL